MVENDKEMNYLQEKTIKSASRIAETFLSSPEIKAVIRKVFVKEGLILGLFMSFFIVGLMSIVSSIKQLLGFGFEYDLIGGLILFLLGTVYILKMVVKRHRKVIK